MKASTLKSKRERKTEGWNMKMEDHGKPRKTTENHGKRPPRKSPKKKTFFARDIGEKRWGPRKSTKTHGEKRRKTGDNRETLNSLNGTSGQVMRKWIRRPAISYQLSVISDQLSIIV